MNEKKKGKPYSFPDSFILVISHVPTYLHLPYMQTKGVINGTEKTFPNHPSYGHRCKRINRLNIEFNSNNTSKDNDDLTIALDSTGIKVTNKGQWISHKWNTQKKGALQIHIAIVNIKTMKYLL